MSAAKTAPQGRGAIAFALDAVYWVEMRGKGSDWVFNAKEPAAVSAVEALQDTTAETSRITLPDPVTKPFEITRVNRESPGRVFQLPSSHLFRTLDVDPQSGDVAVLSAGGSKEQNGTWLTICRAAELNADAIRPATALLFKGIMPVSLRYKRLGDRTWLLVVRDDALWVLDPQTLRMAELDNPTETLHFTEPIHDFVLLQDRFLFLQTQKTNPMADALGPFHAFELPGLKQTQLTEILSGARSFTRVAQTTDGWLVGPAVLDDRLKSIKSLHSLSWSGLGYISSTEFAGVSNDLGTQVITRKPLPRPNGRNKDVSIPVGDDSVSLTAKTVELNQKGPRRLPLVQLDISFTSTNANWKPVEFPLAIYERLYGEISALAKGKGVAVIADRKLYSFFPEDLGVKLPIAAKPSGLTLRARKPVSALSARKSTTVPFVAEGGKPPYEYKVAMDLRSLHSSGPSRTPPEELIKVAAKSGAVTIEGQTLAEALLDGPLYFTIALSQYAMRHDPTGTPEKVVADYIQEVSNKLQPALGAPVHDYPVGVPIVVTVTDANKQEVSLRHELVLELPRQRIIDSIKGESKQDRGPEPKKMPLDQLGIANPAQPRTLIVPAPDLPLIWNDGTQVDISNELRRLWPRVAIDDPQWSVARLAACSVIMASERLIAEIQDPRQGSGLPARAWRTTDGKEITGRLVGANEREISVREEGQSFAQRLPLQLLDDESLEHAWIGVQRLRKVPEYVVRRGTASGRRTTTVQPHPAGAGMHAFRNHYGCLPPRAIVDEAGKPLLSWRVSLLPYLGYQKLFHLFHLDEPWDSEHNRKLIPYMPMFYNSTQSGLPLGKTTFKALSGPGTAFPDNGLRRLYDFEGNPANALLIVEVDKGMAVQWTKPEDLIRTEDQAWTDQLYKVQVEGNDFSHGIFGDGVLWIFRISDEDK